MPALHHSCVALALLALAACSSKHGERDAVPDAIAAASPEDRKCSDDLSPFEPDKLPRCTGRDAAMPAGPQAFHIASEGGQCVIEGDACNLERPFKLSGCGIKNYYTFTPTSASAGSFAYRGRLMGVEVGGGGDYTVDASEAGGSIQTMASRNCASAGGVAGCNGINLRFRLTPIAACGNAP